MVARLPALAVLAPAMQTLIVTAALAQAAPPLAAQPTEIPHGQAAPGDAVAPPAAAADVALKLVQAGIARDWQAAATYVTGASQADFLALMDLSDRLQKARSNLHLAIEQKFKREETRGLRAATMAGVVLTAEVAAQRQVSPTLVELDMRVHTTQQNRPTQMVTWRAVHADGAWKIELPGCTSPESAALLKQNLQRALAAHVATTSSIKKGEFSTAAAAWTALVTAQRATVPDQTK